MRLLYRPVLRAVGVAALGAALVLSPPPAAAQEDVDGIAIARAPEGVFHACHGGNADNALACARRACREAGGDTCLRVRWCYPAGWSGAMTYLANREVTRTTFLCGAPSAVSLARMLAALCASDPSASECRLAVAWDPEGNESEPLTLLGKNTAP